MRGLLSANREQKQQWFLQAETLDPKFAGPLFELGKLALDQKQYLRSVDWLRRITPTDPNYAGARFRMGLGDLCGLRLHIGCAVFSGGLKDIPDERGLQQSGAQRRINCISQPPRSTICGAHLKATPNSTVYLFNLGTALVRNSSFDEAAKVLEQLLARDPNGTPRRVPS